MRDGLGIALAALLAAPSLAQGISPEAEHELRVAQVAFRCAALAASAGDTYSDKASPLAQRGYEAAVSGYPVIQAMMTDNQNSLGPLAEFLTSRTDDFWIGTAFISASVAVTTALEKKHPPEGLDFDLLMMTREIEAASMFRQENCELIR